MALRSRRRHRPLRSLALESLENRNLLAVLSVGPSGDFATIQEAIDNARSRDEIEVADGTYAESIDLSRMGIAVSGGPGHLRIAGVGSGAVIESPGGPALFNSAAFAGNVSVDSLSLESSNATASQDVGLRLNAFNGNFAATNITIDTALEGGIDIRNSAGLIDLRDINILDSGSAAGEHGIRLQDNEGILSVINTSIRDAADTGILIHNSGAQEAAFLVIDTTVSGDSIAFATTDRGIVVELAGTTRTDLTIKAATLEDLDQSAIKITTSQSSELQARLDRTIVVNTNQATAFDIDFGQSSRVAMQLIDNTISETNATAAEITFSESAEGNLILDNNLFLNIGDDGADQGLIFSTTSNASGVVNLLLSFNDFLSIQGNGLDIHGSGTAILNVTATENTFSDVNQAGGSGAFQLRKASSGSQAQFNADLRDNSVSDSMADAYVLTQLGSGLFRLEGTEASAAAQLALDNLGAPINISGTILIVPVGSFDASQPLLLGDRIWHDLNGDGIQDQNEPGEVHREMTLTGVETVSGASVNRTSISDDEGIYTFPGLLPGSYTLTLEVPNGRILADVEQGADTTLDNNFPRSTGSVDVTLGATVSDVTIDAGLITSWQNPDDPRDVDDDKVNAPVDVLILVNDLNTAGSRILTLPPPGGVVPPYLDVNGDGLASPVDPLVVINFLNSGGVSPEGEAAAPTPPSVPASFAGWISPLTPEQLEEIWPDGVPPLPKHLQVRAGGFPVLNPKLLPASIPTEADSTATDDGDSDGDQEVDDEWEALLDLLAEAP